MKRQTKAPPSTAPAGIKNDRDKARWDLIPWDAVRFAGDGVKESLASYSETRDLRSIQCVAQTLIDTVGLGAVAAVLTHGAETYGDTNWLHVDRPRDRYLAALWRHYDKGLATDPGSGLPHLAHAACNALFLLHFEIAELDR